MSSPNPTPPAGGTDRKQQHEVVERTADRSGCVFRLWASWGYDWGKSLHPSGSQFYHLWNRNNTSYFRVLSWERARKALGQCLAVPGTWKTLGLSVTPSLTPVTFPKPHSPDCPPTFLSRLLCETLLLFFPLKVGVLQRTILGPLVSFIYAPFCVTSSSPMAFISSVCWLQNLHLRSWSLPSTSNLYIQQPASLLPVYASWVSQTSYV